LAIQNLMGLAKASLDDLYPTDQIMLRSNISKANFKIRPHVLEICVLLQFLFNDTMNMCQPSCDQNDI